MKHTKVYKYKILLGFTLAEVLITLGIIGVVAAMTIPTVINNTNSKELKTAFKKAYSASEQAYMAAVQDNGGGFGGYSCDKTISVAKWNAFKSKFQVTNSCDGSTSILGTCWASTATTPEVSAGCVYYQAASQPSNAAFTTPDGMYWMAYGNGVGTNMCPMVAVDVNGNKGPNQWGKDVFTIELADTGLGSLGSCSAGSNAERDILLNK